MSTRSAPQTPRRIAIIGGGISGMGAAYALAPTHRVTVFEAEPRLGGHARTVMAGKRGNQPVDTGFIVFNHANYPELTALFDTLGVATAESEMTFAASIDGGRVEYALNTLGTLFAQRRNLLRPHFLRMVRDLLHFNANAEAVASSDPEMTIGGLLDRLGTGPWFRDHYLLPFSGAIWSTPTEDILDFPAAAMLRFFRNHALLAARGQHQWYTVAGGSIDYVRRLEASLRRLGAEIRLGQPVAAVRRTAIGCEIATNGTWEPFDEVIFATHADDTLSMLADPTDAERTHLGAVRYQPNEAVLHADPSVMPRRRTCWSAWNYAGTGDPGKQAIGVTYWMNALQPIPTHDPLFVTLNGAGSIREDLIYDTTTFRHPLYDAAALRAQKALAETNGLNNTWVCGAWMKNGFHEDGLSSGLDVARAILAREPMLVAAE